MSEYPTSPATPATHVSPVSSRFEKAAAAIDDKATQSCERIAAQVAASPLPSVAMAFGAGYVAGKLPIGRLIFGSLGLMIPLVPHALIALGAYRVWEMTEARDAAARSGQAT